jgi:cAMP-specific phosphodiesterase 4
MRFQYNKRKNPFHNFDHGISVMHGCFAIINKSRAQAYLSDLSRFSLILSGKNFKDKKFNKFQFQKDNFFF